MKCMKVDERTICYECAESYNFDETGDCILNNDVYCLFERNETCLKCSTTMIEPYECEQNSATDTNEGELKTATNDEEKEQSD